MSIEDPKSTAASGDRSNSMAAGVLSTLWTLKYRHHFAQEKILQASTYYRAREVADKFLAGLRAAKFIELRPFVQLSEKWLAEAIAAEKAEADGMQKELGLKREDPLAAPVNPPISAPPRDPRLAPPADAIPIRDKSK